MGVDRSAARTWREQHQREDGSYDAEMWGEVDENGELIPGGELIADRRTPSAAQPHVTLGGDREKVIDRNARAMKPQEYAWLKAQEFQPPIRVALIEAYERIHGAKS